MYPACNRMYLQVVLALLAGGAEVDRPDPLGCTALHLCCLTHGGGGGGGGGRLVSVLLEARAGVNLAARDGNTALHLACLAGNNAAVGAHV